VTDHLARFVLPIFMCALIIGVSTPSSRAHAQTLTTLYSFYCGSDNCTDGFYPLTSLVQGIDGELYGTTEMGGAHLSGTVFKITPSGRLTTLYAFCAQAKCVDGSGPFGGVVLGANGHLYGTTASGGAYVDAYGGGTVYEITPSGTLTLLHSFCSPTPTNGCTDGWLPYAAVVQATNGDLYGTTEYGGAFGAGTVFKITTTGTAETLHSFCAQSECADGDTPQSPLMQATNGNLYGTTHFGGTYGGGVVFEVTPSGSLKTLDSFCAESGCADKQPAAGLVQASNGELYGTTSGYGAGGTVYRMTPSGTLTTLYSFCVQQGCTNGEYPDAGLIQANDGNLYGTTSSGGAYGYGTIFKITPSGTLSTLYSFCAQSGCSDGEAPEGLLVQATNGDLYGATYSGGAYRAGTIFRLSLGLGPFVETLPAAGEMGATITILGTDLMGATSVTFNGTAATFTVASPTAIRATVPMGATTGTVAVTTPSGTLLSNVAFRVVQ
jgi:uncharacterized repeat protein (TIGR03803 family)